MQFNIDTNKLEKAGLTIKEFGILLFYVGGGVGTIDKYICNKLWSKGYLIKDISGYTFNEASIVYFENFCGSDFDIDVETRMYELASKLQKLYPGGRKEGTSQMWRDSTEVIQKKLLKLISEFKVEFTDAAAIEATKRYVAEFDNNKTYMQLLKYFIFKQDFSKGEVSSQLLSYIENI